MEICVGFPNELLMSTPVIKELLRIAFLHIGFRGAAVELRGDWRWDRTSSDRLGLGTKTLAL
jgi:hypothetical protein